MPDGQFLRVSQVLRGNKMFLSATASFLAGYRKFNFSYNKQGKDCCVQFLPFVLGFVLFSGGLFVFRRAAGTEERL